MSELPTECEQLLISGYVLGDLSPAEALLFEEMLSENPDLNEQVVAMQQTLDAAYAPPEIPPPSGLRDRLLATANAQEANVNAPTPAATIAAVDDAEVATPRQSGIIGKILGAIALVTIAVLSIVNYRFWQTINADRIDSNTGGETYVLRGEELLPTASVKLITDDDKLTATLVADDLPSLPPNQVYALWTVVGKDVPYTTDEKGAILTAVFQVDEAGDFVREIAIPQPHLEPKTIIKIAVTIEDVSTPQAHTGLILLSTEG